MKSAVAAVGLVVVGLSFTAGRAVGTGLPDSAVRTAPPPPAGVSNTALSAMARQYCGRCHTADSTSAPDSPRLRKGNLTLANFDIEHVAGPAQLAKSELMIRKLRADMMPPPGAARPGGDSLRALVETMEQLVDKAAKPNAGERTFQRLNRPEYQAAIRDLLGLEVNAGNWLPLDQMSANFDNIGDAQHISATLLNAYVAAATDIARRAVGDRRASSTPIGTRGGIVVTHTFPADGKYAVTVNVGGGQGTRLEDIDVTIDGQRVARLHYERGVALSTERLPITAGQHKISVAFIRRVDGPYEDLVKPNGASQSGNGSSGAGATVPPPINGISIVGPTDVTGISDNAPRKIIFSCRPATAAEERPCAERIVANMGHRAFRRPLATDEVTSVMTLYDKGFTAGGFEEGIRMALTGILASPRFVFRVETPPPAGVAPGEDYRISDRDLATRLSFFLWGSIPDSTLLALAEQNKLSNKSTLERQVKRMLADPRAPTALAERFGAQWLRIQDLDKVHPDNFFFPDYSEQTATLMRRETLEFFADLVRGDHDMRDMLTAKYTFLNEELAQFYGIPGVGGDFFRRVEYPDSTRRGVLGHGSYLVQTSFGNRTSPVLRGKYILEVLVGAPPPPPPPDVPLLEQTAPTKDGKILTTRERVELHRANAVCKACHQYMDPIGLAVDNFDVTARWRYQENFAPLDTRSAMYDGSPLSSAADLSRALVKRPIPLMRTLAENLMAYGIGRRMEDFDQPTIRSIAKAAEKTNYRFSSFVMGVVNSQAFQYRRAPALSAEKSR
jgi:hypothetical protein